MQWCVGGCAVDKPPSPETPAGAGRGEHGSSGGDSTLVCHSVFVWDQGRIIEEHTHAELAPALPSPEAGSLGDHTSVTGSCGRNTFREAWRKGQILGRGPQ